MMARAIAAETPSTVLTKEQLAAHFGKHRRWVERQMKAGMPSIPPTDRYPGRTFRLDDVEEWLASRKAVPPVDRVTRLEARVDRLERLLQQPDGSATSEHDERSS